MNLIKQMKRCFFQQCWPAGDKLSLSCSLRMPFSGSGWCFFSGGGVTELCKLDAEREKKENRCICSCKWVMQGAVAPGRSEWEPQRVGCWAVLTFASVPLSRGEESSGLSVFPSASPVTLVIRAADGPARPPLFYLSVSVRPYQCSAHPLCPICMAPLEGRLAGQHPFVPLFQCKQTVWSLVLLPVFVRCESRCSMKDLFWLFRPPLKL